MRPTAVLQIVLGRLQSEGPHRWRGGPTMTAISALTLLPPSRRWICRGVGTILRWCSCLCCAVASIQVPSSNTASKLMMRDADSCAIATSPDAADLG